MKFSCILQDVAAIESFIKYVSATCRLGKKRCCIKLQNDGLGFISCTNIHEGGAWFSIFLPLSSQLFRRFEFVGLNPRNPESNFIFFEIDVDSMVRILPGGHCYLKMKLSKNDRDEPILAVDVRSPDTDIVSHQVPITIILSRYWKSYTRPTIGHRKMSITLPRTKVIYRVINSLKNLGVKTLKFSISNNGDLRLVANRMETDIDILYTDLPVNVTDLDSQEDTAKVQILLKYMRLMLLSFSFSKTRFNMDIISHRMVEFTFDSGDGVMSYIVGNISD